MNFFFPCLLFDILVLDNKLFCFQMYQKSCMLSLSISLWASKAPGFCNLCYLESKLRFIKNNPLIFCSGMYNAKKWLPWSSTLVVQDSLIALDIGVSLCLQLNSSQSAAVAVCCCSVQQIDRCLTYTFNRVPVVYLFFMYKYYLFPDSYLPCGLPRNILPTDRHGSRFFYWLGFKQQPTLQLRWDLIVMWSLCDVC